MKLGEKIRILRENREWKQRDLAEKLCCSEDTVSKWEVGKNQPSTDRVKDLANMFDVPVGNLLDETWEPIEFFEIDSYPVFSHGWEEQHKIFDADLYQNAKLHRFKNKAGISCSAIYRGSYEILTCLRDEEPGMIKHWNSQA